LALATEGSVRGSWRARLQGLKSVSENSISHSVPKGRLNFRPVQIRSEKRLGSAATLYATVALSFVIPSVHGFPASPLSPATTYVVLPKENHMQLTEAATPDRKSGEGEGSAVPRTSPGSAKYYTQTILSSRPERTRISCHAAMETNRCAAFSEESRMNFRQRHQSQQEIRGSGV
jgi:hypothetical protein